jgi:hypothetical protein
MIPNSFAAPSADATYLMIEQAGAAGIVPSGSVSEGSITFSACTS